MEKDLRLTEGVIEYLQNYLKKEKKERVVAIFLVDSKETVIGTKIYSFEANDYIENSRKFVSLKMEKLKECILYAIENQYVGFLLVHNHPIWAPFFSKGDKITLKSTMEHLKIYGYPLLHGIGIVTKGRMSILFIDNYVKSYSNIDLVEYQT